MSGIGIEEDLPDFEQAGIRLNYRQTIRQLNEQLEQTALTERKRIAAWLRERAKEYRKLGRTFQVSRALEAEEIADELDPPKPATEAKEDGDGK